VPIPQRIAEAPELLPWLNHVFGAFFELSTCRHELGPIPWTALHLYVQAHEVEDLEWFTGLIRAMDSAYIAHHNKKRIKAKVGGEKKKVGKK
jgi:hypothetical protein